MSKPHCFSNSRCGVFMWSWEIRAIKLHLCVLQQIDFVLPNYTSCRELPLCLSRGESVHVSVGGGEGGAGLGYCFFRASHHLFWVRGGSPSTGVRGWVYPLQRAPHLSLSLCLCRGLSPLAHPPPLPPFLYVLLNRCQPSNREPFVPESPPIFSLLPFICLFISWRGGCGSAAGRKTVTSLVIRWVVSGFILRGRGKKEARLEADAQQFIG